MSRIAKRTVRGGVREGKKRGRGGVRQGKREHEESNGEKESMRSRTVKRGARKGVR